MLGGFFSVLFPLSISSHSLFETSYCSLDFFFGLKPSFKLSRNIGCSDGLIRVYGGILRSFIFGSDGLPPEGEKEKEKNNDHQTDESESREKSFGDV